MTHAHRPRRRRRVRRKASRRPQEDRRGRGRLSLVGRRLEPTQAIAAKYGIGHACTDLAEALARDDVDAVILCTPTQMHAAQAIQCMDAGKHVQVEIPLADSLGRCRGGARQAAGDRAGLHGRPHPALQPEPPVYPQQDRAARSSVQQMDVQTYFFRRKNMNAKGEARSAGPTICCGTTPRTPSICSPIRRARSSRPTRSRARSIPSSASRWTCRSS